MTERHARIDFMRLTRNTTPDGKCKYAIVRLDKIRQIDEAQEGTASGEIDEALAILEEIGVLEYGEPGTDEEFFVIKLKDENAYAALEAYSECAKWKDEELADDVFELAERARDHKSQKQPD